MDTLLQDLKYAIRMLTRERGFSITAILTLALVIGANVAIFSVINSVLLQPLPFEGAEDLVRVFNSYPNAGAPRASNSVPDYYDRRLGVEAFEEVATYRGRGYTIGTDGSPLRTRAMQVTPSFFPLLGVEPELGRAFAEEEGEIGNHRRVILSHSLWQELYGGNVDVIGEELHVDGVLHQVVGVMAPSFFFLDPGIQVWTPQAFTDEQREEYHSNSWNMIARLAVGATVEQAQAQIDAINAQHIERFPQWREILVNAGFHSRAVSLQDDLVRDIRQTFHLLWAGVFFVLLIGCVNVANLALVRASVRIKELSMRAALGADHFRVACQLITESVLLTVTSAALGLGLGWAGVRTLDVLGMDQLPRGAEVGIDATVVLVTLSAALVIGAILGLIPVLHVVRADTAAVLREEGRSTTVGRRAQIARRSLVTLQVATAFVLLIGAGLLFTSFRQILAIDPGFEPEGVFTAMVMLPLVDYPEDDDRRGFAGRALAAIQALPEVENAAITSTIPFGGSYSDSVILAEGYEMQPGESLISPNRIVVSPGYFATLGVALVEGRFFDQRDTTDGQRTVIVDEGLARKFWPGQSPLGKRMYRPLNPDDLLAIDENTDWLTVVGVVDDIKLRGLVDADQRVGTYYFPFDQSPTAVFSLTVKTSAAPALLLEPVRRTLAEVDPELPLFDTRTMADRISESLVARRSPMLLTVVFAGVALFLAAVGLYGVLAYLVSQRTREIGIRMALGSGPREVFQLIMKEGLSVLAVGLVAGVSLTVLLRGTLVSHLYGVGPLEPMVLTAVAAVLAAVALAACSFPALRATRVHPATALHD